MQLVETAVQQILGLTAMPAVDGKSAGCQNSICRPPDLHCCQTCSLRMSWPGGCRVCLALWQPVQLPAVPLLGRDVCCLALSPQPYVPRHYQCPVPYLHACECQDHDVLLSTAQDHQICESLSWHQCQEVEGQHTLCYHTTQTREHSTTAMGLSWRGCSCKLATRVNVSTSF